MSTPIQAVPDVVLAPEFPTLADRPAGLWNQKAKAHADGVTPMSIRNREIALTVHNNALAAREAADEAVPAAVTAVAARDKALEYRDSAQAAAAAAGSGAGLPSLTGNAGKALIVGGDEDAVGWGLTTPTLGVRNVNAAATITVADQALMLRCSGVFTLSFAAVASLPPGWFCYIKNAGDGDITLDLAGSEAIDGRPGYIMYPGECRIIAHNGVEFVSVVLNAFRKTFTATGTFIKPPGYRAFEGVTINGGNGGKGGDGGQSSGTAGGSGGEGGKGGKVQSWHATYTLLADTSSVIIGSGGVGSAGAAQNQSATPGGAGGSTSIASGGTGPEMAAQTSASGGNAGASNQNPPNGSKGADGTPDSDFWRAPAGGGGGGGAGYNSSFNVPGTGGDGGLGGTSSFGGGGGNGGKGGGNGAVGSTGTNGTGIGAGGGGGGGGSVNVGGSGATSGGTGGNGAAGAAFLWGII